MTPVNVHQQMMRRALVLARRGLGKTSPNPAVGCVIARNGSVVGEGWHHRAGTPHAEVHALQQAGKLAQGADVYVTLEPCSHHGRTPPCAEALVAAEVGRVFAAMVDPNPLVSGRGLAVLQQAGITTDVGLMAGESHQLNEAFIKQITTGQPFVVLKMAATLDGWSATLTGDSKWITSEASRTMVHRLRSRLDAVMVGIETVLADDPLLTCRHVPGRNPLRVIVDSRLRLPPASRIWSTAAEIPTLVATTIEDPTAQACLASAGIKILVCRSRAGRVDLVHLLSQLAGMGVQSVLLEGGSSLAGAALAAGVVDKVALFYAPKMLGGAGTPLLAGPAPGLINESFLLHEMRVRRIGNDILVEGYLRQPCSPV